MYPLKFKPYLCSKVWGGEKIAAFKGGYFPCYQAFIADQGPYDLAGTGEVGISLQVRFHFDGEALDKRKGVDVEGCSKGCFTIGDDCIVVRSVEREIPEEFPFSGSVQDLSLFSDCKYGKTQPTWNTGRRRE